MSSTCRIWVLAGSLAFIAFGMASCGGSTKVNSGSGGTTAHTSSAFCADDIKLDKALANIQNQSDLLPAFKANDTVINDMSAHIPSGAIGNEARQVLTAVQQAIAKNDITVVENVPNSYGGDIDTYCGVDSNGDPLPTYFASGKGTPLCNTDARLSTGVNNASDSSQALTFLKANQNDIDAIAAGISGLPSFEQSNAQTLVTTARTAISTNDPSGLDSQSFQDAATSVDLYCGINQ